MRSAIEGHLHNVSTLMLLGNPTADDMNRTLYFACKFKRQDIVEYLVEIGANECGCKKTISDHINSDYIINNTNSDYIINDRAIINSVAYDQTGVA
jgi:hypothetical protein